MSVQVLVADDEALIRQSIRRRWRGRASGHRGRLRSRGVARFQDERPDVVLLDLVLGDADGIDLSAPDAAAGAGQQDYL